MHRLCLFILVSLFLSPALIAAERYWDGDTDTDWATATNWDGDATVPAANDIVNFDLSSGNITVNLAANTNAIAGITVTGGANILQITTSGGELFTNTTSTTINIGTGCAVVIESGINQSAGTLTIYGPGTFSFNNANTNFDANIVVNSGTVDVPTSFSTGSGSITINAGAKLIGNGTTAATTIANGGTIAPSGAGTINTGDLTLNSASIIEFNIGDTAAGSNDLINVTGNATVDGVVVLTDDGSSDIEDDVYYSIISVSGTLTDNDLSFSVPGTITRSVDYASNSSTAFLKSGNPSAPTLTTISNLTGATEDTAFTINYSDLIAAADEADADGDDISFRFKVLTSGTLNQGGASASVNDELAAGSDPFVWTPASDANGTIAAFEVVAYDGDKESTPNIQVSVVVTAVNEAPTAANFSKSGTDGTNVVITIGDFSFSDEEDSNLTLVEIVNAPSNGTLYNDGNTDNTAQGGEILTATDTISFTDINNGQLKFLPSGSGSPYDTFTFKVEDSGSLQSVSTYTCTLNISSAGNTAPTLSATTLAMLEDTDLVLSSGMLGYSDADNDPISTLNVNTAPSNGQLYVDADEDGVIDGASEELIATESASKADLDAGRVKFKPASNATGTPYDSIILFANDGTADGATATFPINVTAVNDAPIANTSSVSTAEGVTHTFSLSEFLFTDVDNGSMASVEVLTLPGNGTLQYSGSDASVPQVVTAADFSSNELTFIPGPGQSGTPYATFTFTVNDGSTDSLNSAVMSIDVTGNAQSWDDGSTNDAWDHNSGKNWDPDGVPGVDSTLILDTVAVDNEVDMNVDSNPILSMSITGSGNLTILGAPDGFGGKLVFSNSATLNIPSGVVFQVECPIDFAGSNGTLNVTGGGTLRLEADSGSAVHDDTLIINGGVTLIGTGNIGHVQLENGATFKPGLGGVGTFTVEDLTCSTTSIIEIEVDDDATAGADDLIVVNGTLTMNGFLEIEQTDATLDTSNLYTIFSLSSLPTGSFNVQMPGADPGAIQYDAAGVYLGVGNQAPTVTGATIPTNEDTDVGISTANLGYSDPEPDPLDFITLGTISAGSGFFYEDDNPQNLSYDAGEELSSSDTLSLTELNNGEFRYHPGTNQVTSATVDFTATDDQGGTSTTATITITINAQNDPPQFDSTAVLTATDNQPYTYNITVSDPETVADSLTVTAPTKPSWLTLSDTGVGTWSLSGTPLSSDIGNHNVTLTVSDGALSVNQIYVINVSDGNSVPVLPTLSTFNKAIKNTDLTLSYNTILTHTSASDPDGDTLRFRVTAIYNGTLENGGATVNVGDYLTTTDTWTWTPPLDDENVTVQAFRIEANDTTLDSGTPRDFYIFVDTVDLPPEQIYLGTNNSGIIEVDNLAQITVPGASLYYYDPEDTGGPDFHFNGQPGWTNPYPAKTTQPVNEANVTYTITAHLDNNVGDFFLGGSVTALGINDTFTQEDIMDGDLVYKHVGDQFDGSSGNDQYTFKIDDGNGNEVTGVTLNIQPVFSALAPVVDLFAQSVGGSDPGTFFFSEDASATLTYPSGTNTTQLFPNPYVNSGLPDYSGGEMVISIADGEADAGDNFYIVNGTGWYWGSNIVSVSGNVISYSDNVFFPFITGNIGSIDVTENGLSGQSLRVSWTGHNIFTNIPSREIIRDLLSRISYRYIGDDPPTTTRTIQVQISDSNGVFGTGSRDLTISASNDPPANISDVTLTVLDGAIIRAVFDVSDPDNEIGDLSLVLKSGPNSSPQTGSLLINDPENNVITYEDFASDSGVNDTFTLAVTDGSVESTVPATITIVDTTIHPTDPPTLASDAPMIVEEGVNFFYTPQIDPRWLTDNPGYTFTYTLAGQVPVGMSISGTQVQWINPDPQDVKNASIGLIIQDANSGKVGYQPIIITVKSVGTL